MENKIQEQGKAFDFQNPALKKDNTKIKNSTIYSRISSSSFQSQQIQIPEQQIIIKDSSQQALISSIICPICLMTLPMPYYECQQCNNSFCPGCIQDWWNKLPSNQEKQCIFKCQNPTFKKVKRSNTYAALLDNLQFKCGLCALNLPLSSYEKHNTKQCPQIQIQCTNQNCRIKLKRKNLISHQQICEYRLEKCKYCSKSIILKNLFDHEQKYCPDKLLSCKYKECKKLIKMSQFQNHCQTCQFKQQECPWCNELFLQKQFINHEIICQSKTIACQWCTKTFNIQQFQTHNCLLKKQLCKLCQKSFLSIQLKEHKNQCMFDNMVVLKEQNQALTQQNTKLHYKLNQLQQLLEDTIANSEGKALQVLKKMKLSERKQLEKDLLRIDNSLASINKLRDQEVNNHTNKYKHFFGSSLCIQCKFIQKRFIQMKQPLTIKRRQVLQKISEFDHFNQTIKG